KIPGKPSTVRRRKKLTADQRKVRAQLLTERKLAKEKRRLIDKEQRETEKTKRIRDGFVSIFNPLELDTLAKKTGFIKKRGELTAIAFVYIVSFGFLGNGQIALSYLTVGLSKHFNISISPQALSKRINSLGSVKLLKATLNKLLEIQLELGLKNKFSETFSMFTGVFLQDSSQCELNEMLSKPFKGSGGGASTSALKLDFIYDIANLLVRGMKLSSGSTNDQTNTKEILKYIKSGSLVLRDLGYFTVDVLKCIEGKGAYYLSRLSIKMNVYLNKDDKDPVNIVQHLKMLKSQGQDPSSIKVYIGKNERFETRLVAEKVPKKVIEQRKARYRKDRKKTPSNSYIEWCGYSIFITNIPEGMFSGAMILALYKIRWQIELVFKNFKSNLEIDVLKGTNKHRIETLVYGKLITIVTLFIIQNYAAHSSNDLEISGDKLTKYLISDNRLREAVINDEIPMLLIIMEHELPLICKQKRKRKTTFEEVNHILKMEDFCKNAKTNSNGTVDEINDNNPLEKVA
ncbi:MAG: IS4 family transposase, partial [Mangrovimonas sp.]|nr:IS4 family transposase [Mangrovimonas sp.]